MSDSKSIRSRYQGSMIGLAAGDALGTTLEFAQKGSFTPITDMVGGGPFKLRKGEWTDDTSMALCSAQSLVGCSGFDPVDHLRGFVRWKKSSTLVHRLFRREYMTSNGKCFDVGTQVRTALDDFSCFGNKPFRSNTDRRFIDRMGNGSLMRIAPVALFYANDLDELDRYSAESSRTTHPDQRCVDACRVMARMIGCAVTGGNKELILSSADDLPGLQTDIKDIILSRTYTSAQDSEIGSEGAVTHTLKTALWGFYHNEDYRSGALKIANFGGDADTNAAVYGQLMGAFVGFEGIPSEWSSVIARKELILSLADKILDLAYKHEGVKG